MLLEPNCSLRRCVHFRGIRSDDGTEQSEVPYCSAFPDGIPYRISYGDDPHDTVAPDQTGTEVYLERLTDDETQEEDR